MTTMSHRDPAPDRSPSRARAPRARRVSLTTTFALVASALAVPLAAPASAAEPAPAADYTQFVNPFIGTEGDFGQDGPGAFTPHGLAKITPLTNPRNHVGYDYASSSLRGFTSVTLDGVGAAGAGGDFLVSPTYQTYTARPSTSSYDKAYSHSNESAAPGYYRVGLTEAGKTIDARVTADTRTGVEDYTFGSAGTGSLVVDLANNFGTRQGATLAVGRTADGRTTLSGSLKSYFYNSASTLYYYAETTVPTSAVSTWGAAGLSSATKAQDGTDIGAILSFDVAAGDHVGLKVTLSPISSAQAARDQGAEIGAKSFGDVRAAATAEWNAALGAVEISEGADDDPTGDLKTQFYTHLFRMNGSPLNATSTDGTYRGVDGKIYEADGYTHYDSWSLWDDFHKYSSIAAIYPDVYRDIAQSLVDLYARMTNSGASSVGSLMQSVPTVRWERSAVVIADALNKGAELEGLEAAYPSLVKTSNGGYSSTNEALGFISGSVADTVGTAYDDWAMSVIATKLGKSADAAKFLKRSTNYVNLFNKAALTTNPQALASGTGVENVGLLMPRTASGWTANVDPEVFEAPGAGLYQGTLWQYNWYDAQDMGGMIELMGGKAGARTALSYLYGEQAPEDCTRMLHLNSNEIDLQSPYLFNYVGAPSRTQYWARSILTTPTCQRYAAAKDSSSGPQGLNGKGEYTTPQKLMTYQNATKGFLQTMDNDAATMSSVFVSGALGLFPVTSGADSFQIGSPVFEKVTLHYPGGTDFVIEADGTDASNLYIQGATLNGSPLHRTWLTYDELMAGGTVRFDMGSTPSSWGVDSPMAYSMSDEVPSSVYDRSSAVATATQAFVESDANDGSIGNAITVSVTGATFDGEIGADVTSEVTASGLPEGLAVKAVVTGASTLSLTLTGKADQHQLDDSTDGLVVTLAEGAFTGTVPSAQDRELALKVRFTGYGITPSTTALAVTGDGTVDRTVDLTLTGGATFAGTIPAGSITFPSLDHGVTAVVTRTGATTARVAFTGRPTSTSVTRFFLRLSDAALSGVAAAQVSGPGTSSFEPFTLTPASTTRADLKALYDDARLIGAGSYSAASYTALSTAVASARTVLADADASEFVLTQALVNLRSALDGLTIGEGGYRVLQGEAYDAWSGGSLKTESGGTGTVLAGVSPDSWIAYRGLDFTDAALQSVQVSYAHNPGSASGSAKVEIRTGSATGPLVTTVDLPTTGAWTTFAQAKHTFTAGEVAALAGVNDVYLVFRGSADKAWVANIDYVQFQPVATGGGDEQFAFTKLTPVNVMTVGPNVGRDGAAPNYTNFGNTHNEEWIKYGAVQFGPNGADTFTYSYDKPTDKSQAGTSFDIRLGSATGPTVASSGTLPTTGTGWGHYQSRTLSVNPAVFTGTQDVYIVFRMSPVNTTQSAPYVGNFAWFQFGDSTTAVPTEKTVQFESIRSGYGNLDDAAAGLVDGVDYSGSALRTETGSVGGQLAGGVDGSWVRYPGVKLGSKYATSLNVRYDAPSTAVSKGRLAVHVDSLEGEPFVTVDLAPTGSTWGTYRTTSVVLPSELTGTHTLYVTLLSTPTADQPSVGNLDWFSLGYGADKAALRAAIAASSNLEDYGDRYVAAEFAVYTRALAAGRALLTAPSATAADVTKATRDLTLSAGQLRWKVVKQVAELVTTVEALSDADYSPASWATLQGALRTAKALDGDSGYEAYQSGLANLASAYESLHAAYRTALNAPESVDPGVLAALSGSGFEPGETVTFSWTHDPAPTVPWTVVADDDGHVATTVTFPRLTGDGTYELRAVGAISEVPATTDVVVAKVMRPSQTSLHAPTTVTVGQVVPVTVAVTDGATGSVELFDGATSLGSSTLGAGSAASFDVSSLSVGAHALRAVYAGDSWYATSTSAPVTVTVKAHTVLTAPAQVDPGVKDGVVLSGSGFAPSEVVTFSWTGAPALTASWKATAGGDGSVTTAVTIPRTTPDGTYRVSAVGATTRVPATADVVVVKVMKASETAFLGVPATVTQGDVLPVSVGVTAGATGTVTLYDGATSLGSATVDAAASSASFTVTGLALGAHSLTAVYAGDSWYRASTSAAVTVTVTARPVPPVPAKVSLSAPVLSKASQVYGSSTARLATITTTVKNATSGKVTFKAGSKVLGTASVVKVGTAYTATARLSATLAVGSYKGLTATIVTGKTTVTSPRSAAVFTVVKATTSKVSVSARAFTKRTRPTVHVAVATLSNGRAPTGKVVVYVGGRVAKTVTLYAGAKGKVAVTLPHRYSSSIRVKAKFLPSSPSTVTGRTSSTIAVHVRR
ncbi:glycoside hydrolase domain-containing protein [Cellulomonas edaphi]|uniref:Glycoside hydrolase family 92 protein n=1 Tax=Cellulomonas edaphi TaxID=3053468 RepID=A0ABT7S7J6_9CELL|nr:glycoside hydrolase domain-containing protein [Cellulomons edaphi]MDM7831596.1 glycoside hydrolase family 92 protein [Cellulomons edaphi]